MDLLTPEVTLLLYKVDQLATSPFCRHILPNPHGGHGHKLLTQQHVGSCPAIRLHFPSGGVWYVSVRDLVSHLTAAARATLRAVGSRAW